MTASVLQTRTPRRGRQQATGPELLEYELFWGAFFDNETSPKPRFLPVRNAHGVIPNRAMDIPFPLHKTFTLG